MKNILIASFDMEIGGVERSLVNLLEKFDYDNYKLDLLLYRHSGEFMPMISEKVNLLEENRFYRTIRMGIGDLLRNKNYLLATGRIRAKVNCKIFKSIKKCDDTYQMQLMWKYCNKYFPRVEKEYEIAISYLWPHDFVANKVKAKKKIAWIHTDYSVISPDRNLDLKVWEKYDHIVAVSIECLNSFLKIYPSLKNKTLVIENITSQEFIRKMSIIENVNIFQRENFNILSVGRLTYQKAFDEAIIAMKILKDKGYGDIKWYVVGYGGDEEILKKLIEKYSLKDDFILLGKKENPYPYMRECDLYVQPSRYEGKAVTVVEAQSLGKCVLITDYPTAQSQIKQGVDGEICDGLSPEKIALGIEKLYKDRNLIKEYEENCNRKNYNNMGELEKLYELFR